MTDKSQPLSGAPHPAPQTIWDVSAELILAGIGQMIGYCSKVGSLKTIAEHVDDIVKRGLLPRPAAPVAVPAEPKCILCGKIADEHPNRLWCSQSEDCTMQFTPPLDAPPLPPPQEPTKPKIGEDAWLELVAKTNESLTLEQRQNITAVLEAVDTALNKDRDGVKALAARSLERQEKLAAAASRIAQLERLQPVTAQTLVQEGIDNGILQGNGRGTQGSVAVESQQGDEAERESQNVSEVRKAISDKANPKTASRGADDSSLPILQRKLQPGAESKQELEDTCAVLMAIIKGWKERAETAEAALTQAHAQKSALMEALEPFVRDEKLKVNSAYFRKAQRVYEQVKEKI